MHKAWFHHWHLSCIPSWPLWQQLALCVGLSLGLIAVLQLTIGASSQRVEQQQQITMNLLKNKLTAQQQQLLTYKNNAHFLLKSISVADLLSQLSHVAKANQLEFDAIKPLPVIKQQRLWVQPIVLSTQGNYRQLLNFCRQLQQLSAVNAIQAFRLESGSAEANAVLFLRITLAVYSDRL